MRREQVVAVALIDRNSAINASTIVPPANCIMAIVVLVDQQD